MLEEKTGFQYEENGVLGAEQGMQDNGVFDVQEVLHDEDGVPDEEEGVLEVGTNRSVKKNKS